LVGLSLILDTQWSRSQTYVKTKIVLRSGGTSIARSTISQILTAVIQEGNRLSSRGDDDFGNLSFPVGNNFDRIRSYFTSNGFMEFRQLYDNTRFYSSTPLFELNLIETPSEGFIVRGIPVWIRDKSSSTKKAEYLIFNINYEFLITDVRFSLEQYSYERLIQYGLSSFDLSKRNSIISFLEKFKKAYYTKDIEFIEGVFSDEAVIIVGRTDVKKTNEGEVKPIMDADKISFIRASKHKYIQRLRFIFRRSLYISVEFRNIEIVAHPYNPNLYGVNFQQRWNATNYYDEGYVFLLFEFVNDSWPTIRFRSWQDTPFEDGTIIRLENFEVIK
jgi:hypothetical protein